MPARCVRAVACLSLLVASCSVPDRGFDAGPDATSADVGPVRDAPWIGETPFVIAVEPLVIELRAGERLPLRVGIARRDGFAAPVVIEAWGAPEGIEIERVVAGAADRELTLGVRAAPAVRTQRPIPFTIQGSAQGWRRTVRVTVAVTP